MTLSGINPAWVAEVTDIRLLTGFLYLAAILDRYSRAPGGDRLGDLAAHRYRVVSQGPAERALATRPHRREGLCLHHSDRGVQYASHAYVALLEEAGMAISLSRAPGIPTTMPTWSRSSRP